ncbi:hypothetical protein TWF730_008633 [Orbilia blumenaviensis]|uniref:Uncharacterized protein n=1 Tax=Orbilia blumenaviensis TaxID=1796055 RepID=A0AAV9V2X8_9PEZI
MSNLVRMLDNCSRKFKSDERITDRYCDTVHEAEKACYLFFMDHDSQNERRITSRAWIRLQYFNKMLDHARGLALGPDASNRAKISRRDNSILKRSEESRGLVFVASESEIVILQDIYQQPAVKGQIRRLNTDLSALNHLIRFRIGYLERELDTVRRLGRALGSLQALLNTRGLGRCGCEPSEWLEWDDDTWTRLRLSADH